MTLLYILCAVCWAVLGTMAFIYPNDDWHISYAVAAYVLALIHIIEFWTVQRRKKDER